MNGGNSAGFPLLVSREQAGNAIGNALRLFIGRGRRYSVKQLSNGTGVKDRVIECAMTDAGSVDYRPLPPEALLSIALFLGAAFTNEWIGHAGQGAFDLPDGGDLPPGMVALEASEQTTEIMRRAADNSFCPEDQKALRVVGQAKVQTGMRLMALGQPARKKAA